MMNHMIITECVVDHSVMNAFHEGIWKSKSDSPHDRKTSPMSQGQVRTATEEQKDTINVHNGSIVTTQHHPFDIPLKINTAGSSIRITYNVKKTQLFYTVSSYTETSTRKQGLSSLVVQSRNVVHSRACRPILPQDQVLWNGFSSVNHTVVQLWASL